MRQKINFQNHQQQTLAGLLETPDSPIRAMVLFAHCFTCGKDVTAASRISRYLMQRGFAVFRFDFTGLGNSEGDFSNSNFSSNKEDLLAAAEYLKEHHQAPQLLVGHSLGGAAVLSMASQLADVKAVVTIGAPFNASHVEHNFEAHSQTIEEQGCAQVTLGLRTFNIKKQFLEDIRNQSNDLIGKLNKALLVFHSPLDQTVSINEAEKIYKAAKHPKSFISLDNADHLLSKASDSEYVAQTIAAWATRYLPIQTEARPKINQGQVQVSEADHKFQQHIFTDHHQWYADEPIAVGGKNSGPDPYEHLLAALGACTAMTIRMYANHKKMPLQQVNVTLRHARDYLKDAAQACDKPIQVEKLIREVEFEGELSEVQINKLLEIADKCPVHRTLHNNPIVETTLKGTSIP